MTAEQLWDEYQAMVCPPDLEETGDALHWQRMAFLAGVTATIGSIIERPACFDELCASVAGFLANEIGIAADEEPTP